MRPHQKKLEMTLKVLRKMSGKSSVDFFIAGVDSTNGGKVVDLQAHLNGIRYEAEPSVARALHHVIKRKVYDAKAMRPLSLYIFTDGNWTLPGNDLRQWTSQLRTLSDFLEDPKHKDLKSNHVGIQIVRFGNSERGKSRLAYLDDQISKLARR
jgi:hypothetical protein